MRISQNVVPEISWWMGVRWMIYLPLLKGPFDCETPDTILILVFLVAHRASCLRSMLACGSEHWPRNITGLCAPTDVPRVIVVLTLTQKGSLGSSSAGPGIRGCSVHNSSHHPAQFSETHSGMKAGVYVEHPGRADHSLHLKSEIKNSLFTKSQILVFSCPWEFTL